MRGKTAGYTLLFLGLAGISILPFVLPRNGLSVWQIAMLVNSVIAFMLGIGMIQVGRSEQGRKAFVRYAFPITVLIILDGYFFKFMQWPSAGIQIIFGSFFLCFSLAPVIARNRHERWKSYAESTGRTLALMLADTTGFSLVVLALLFWLQKWPGHFIMGIIGIVLLSISLVSWNQLFEKLFKLQLSTQEKLATAYSALKENHEQLEEKNKEITDSITYAKRIQTAILPPDRIVEEHLPNSFVLYKPKDIVAGDFYWMEAVDDWVFFAAADCTGHGVPGAMVSVICVNGLNRSVREFELRDPAGILNKCRELVIKEFEKSDEEVKDGMDISLCALGPLVSSSDSPSGESYRELKWAGANNPLWIVRKTGPSRASASVSESAGPEALEGPVLEEIKADKQPIGKYGLEKPFTSHTIQLNEGDTIYLFSDGFPDQFGGEVGKKYKSGKFKRTLIELAEKPIDQQRELLDSEFENWRGTHEQIDDVCVIGVSV